MEHLDVRWNDRSRWDRLYQLTKVMPSDHVVTPELIDELQDAIVLAHQSGRLELAEGLRNLVERLTEAMAVATAMGNNSGRYPMSELWLG